MRTWSIQKNIIWIILLGFFAIHVESSQNCLSLLSSSKITTSKSINLPYLTSNTTTVSIDVEFTVKFESSFEEGCVLVVVIDDEKPISAPFYFLGETDAKKASSSEQSHKRQFVLKEPMRLWHRHWKYQLGVKLDAVPSTVSLPRSNLRFYLGTKSKAIVEMQTNGVEVVVKDLNDQVISGQWIHALFGIFSAVGVLLLLHFAKQNLIRQNEIFHNTVKECPATPSEKDDDLKEKDLKDDASKCVDSSPTVENNHSEGVVGPVRITANSHRKRFKPPGQKVTSW